MNDGGQMFFFPFQANGRQASALQGKAPAPLAMLPSPSVQTEKENTGNFADAVSDAGHFGNDLLRKIISSFVSSLTALGSRAGEFFSYISAWLAFDRMARQAQSMMTAGFQAFGLPLPQLAPSAFPSLLFPFSARSLYGFGTGASKTAAESPMTAFADLLTPWMAMWAPAKPAPAPRETIPFTFEFSMPGFAWSVSAR
jgi:hypothetical protein